MSVAIVTGAARGIGRAERLSRNGWQVVCADIDVAASEKLVNVAGGMAVNCDVGRHDDIERLVAATVAQHGRIDAIVSCAGISQNLALKDVTLEDWDRVIAINLTASFLLAKAAEMHLRRSRGAMVLIASTRAHISERNTFAYSASKGGLVALTHALAASLQPDVRVNCVSPGWIDSGKYGALSEEDHAQHLVARVGKPDDVAAAAAFLISAGDAGFITGQEIVVDGGMTKKMVYA